MARLTWDQIGERTYETGIDQGVLYLADDAGAYTKGYAWNGLVSITESPTGAESSPQYADNIKYLNLVSAEEFGFTIEAFTYPEEFGVCDGTAMPETGIVIGQQNRKPFGLSYRTKLGNDTKGDDYGYKIHLVYGCLAAPSEKAYSTVNDSPEAITFSWEVDTTPVPVTGFKPTSLIVINSATADEAKLKTLEDMIYGASGEPKLPTPDEVLGVFNTKVADEGEPVSSESVGEVPEVVGVEAGNPPAGPTTFGL